MATTTKRAPTRSRSSSPSLRTPARPQPPPSPRKANTTRVFVEVDGDPVSPSQPAHIHEGTCDDLTPEPAYGLPNVAGGISDSSVDVTLDELTSGTYAINLHFSDDELTVYTSCGNIEG